MFLHKGLQTLKITSRNTFYDLLTGLNILSGAIRNRSPALTSLVLDIHPYQKGDEVIARIINSLPSLVNVVVPAFPGSPHTWGSLCRSSKLQNLDVVSREKHDVNQVVNAVTISVNLPQQCGFFPVLRRLRVDVLNCSIINPLFHAYRLTHLSQLLIHTCTLEKPGSIRSFLSMVASYCPSITMLVFSCARLPNFIPPPREDILTFEDLRPILKCTRMNFFSFHHKLPLDISDSDLEEMAKTWTGLCHIYICPYPCYFVEGKLTLWSILMLRHSCPKLEEIHLYVNTSTLSLDLTSYPQFNETDKRATLKTLGLGNSYIHLGEESKLAFALVQVLQDDAENCEVGWHCETDEKRKSCKVVMDMIAL